MVAIPLMKLQCGANNYEWGKPGNESAVAKYLAAITSESFRIDDYKPYSELWMGTHSSLPSKDDETGRTLLDLLQDNKALMSTEVSDKFGEKLPFLFKVLSINKALSIQAHPNKKLAEQLHAKDPEHYPDDNHKPEMIIAITKFEGLCGFRPLSEISHFLNTITPLRELVGEEEVQNFKSAISGQESSDDPEQSKHNREALKRTFSALVNNAGSDIVGTKAEELVEEAQSKRSNFADGGSPTDEDGQELADLVVRLNEQFPGDIGLFVLFFLNYVKLNPEEAMFLHADDIHAYLSGDAIECMAASDNVVRAGFTPKFKDILTLTDMLTYSYAPISEQKMSPRPYPHVKFNAKAYSAGDRCHSLLYEPPASIKEFRVLLTDLIGDGAKATFDPLAGPSIIICTKGSGKISVGSKSMDVSEGLVFFVGAGAECVLESSCSTNGGDGGDDVVNGDSGNASAESEQDVFTTFRAFCEA